MARNSTLFPDKNYMYEVGRRLLEFMLASFQRSPDFISLLKLLFTQVSPHILVFQFTELALQLCWAVGEHGGGGGSLKDAARELFESLELLLYENLSSRYSSEKKIAMTLSDRKASLESLILLEFPVLRFIFLGCRIGKGRTKLRVTKGSSIASIQKSAALEVIRGTL
ncbi:hypothetical protein J1N35_004230 [Gossypium stocksii]|uniref:Uncharacterized protein n=1 Tax=Gossypium stocksii TaxID=47602 RepID=A0A9D4AI20_9ROSI|nr:hypothetical protein J1N35_004230 [Gossypium stocksii]